MRLKLNLFIITLFLFSVRLFAQDVQLKIVIQENKPLHFKGKQALIEVHLVDTSGAIVYAESSRINVDTVGICNYIIGSGIVDRNQKYLNYKEAFYIGSVSKVKYFLGENSQPKAIAGVLLLKNVPKSYFSDRVLNAPQTTELDSTNIRNVMNGDVLRYIKSAGAWSNTVDAIADSNYYARVFLHVQIADTSIYANVREVVNTDSCITTPFSRQSGSSDSSLTSNLAFRSGSSDTAFFADTVLFAVHHAGVQIGEPVRIGRIDSSSLNFVVNDSVKLIIGPTGTLLIGLEDSAMWNQFMDIGVMVEGSGIIDSVLLSDKSIFHYSPNYSSLIVQQSKNSYFNSTMGSYSLALGRNNRTQDFSAAIGDSNLAIGNNTIAFGFKNQVTKLGPGKNATGTVIGGNSVVNAQRAVSLGWNNLVDYGSTAVAVGMNNTVYGGLAIALGHGHTANGAFSVCIGKNASTAGRTGALIMSDASGASTLTSPKANAFVARYSGGFNFYSNSLATIGVSLAAGSGSWSTLSDSSLKRIETKFTQSDPSYLSDLKIYNWNYKKNSAQHYGPMAQSFYKATNMGNSKKSISMVDADGIVLFEVKKLDYKMSNHFLHDVHEINRGVKSLCDKNDELSERMNNLLKAVK